MSANFLCTVQCLLKVLLVAVVDDIASVASDMGPLVNDQESRHSVKYGDNRH